MSNKRIGGDFNSLFDDNNMEESEGLRTLRLSEIEPNKGQPRKVFDKEAMSSWRNLSGSMECFSRCLCAHCLPATIRLLPVKDAGEQLK